ncbi:MAG: type II secretion system protein [Lachnospiraceae bacterium]|nr:type II secretion system protein [Lachnospiraceae bacterium]
MKNLKMDNNGFTLIETTVCFILLGILLVAAAQVIASSSEVYYYSKSLGYGVQAAQAVATEIRGELEDAVVQKLNTTADSSIPSDANGRCVYISPDKKTICFISSDGKQVCYTLKPDDLTGNSGYVLTRSAVKIYDDYFELKTGSPEPKDTKIFSPQYVGLNYKVKDIIFTVFDKNSNMPANPATQFQGAGDYPVIIMQLTVSHPQYGDYNCTEYIPLYNYYGSAASLVY